MIEQEISDKKLDKETAEAAESLKMRPFTRADLDELNGLQIMQLLECCIEEDLIEYQ